MKRHILINSLVLSSGILLGRFSGYIRELIIAYKFVVSSDADTIILVLTIPDLINNLIAAGAISGILLPMFSSATNKKEVAFILLEFTKKLLIISLVFYVIVGAVIVFSYDDSISLLLIISLISIFPNIFTFVSSSLLQFKKNFKVIALNTLIFNVVIIFFIAFGFLNYYFALGVILASLFRMVWMLYHLRKINFSFRYFFQKKATLNIKYSLILFMLFANGIVFILPMIDKMFASFMSEGSLAVLSYSEKIYLLPVSVFLTTYAVALFPDISILESQKKTAEIRSLLSRAIGFNFIISIITASVVYFFSNSLVDLFFGFSSIDSTNLSIIAVTLEGYSLAIVFAGSNSILLTLYFSKKWHKYLIFYSIIILILKLSINYSIIYLGYEVRYISYGTSVTLFISFLLLSTFYLIKSKSENEIFNN